MPHLRRRQSWLPYTVGYGSLFGSRGGLYNNAETVELDSENVLQADGDDVLLFRFEVPPEAEHISFRVLAANDYAIDLGAPIGRSGVVGSVWEDWRNVVRAPGNVRNGSNMGWVEFDYGFPSGLELYGANLELDLLGFEVRGDLNTSTQHLIFPVQQGRRHKRPVSAYSLQGKRRVRELCRGLGAVSGPTPIPHLFHLSRRIHTRPERIRTGRGQRRFGPPGPIPGNTTIP